MKREVVVAPAGVAAPRRVPHPLDHEVGQVAGEGGDVDRRHQTVEIGEHPSWVIASPVGAGQQLFERSGSLRGGGELEDVGLAHAGRPLRSEPVVVRRRTARRSRRARRPGTARQQCRAGQGVRPATGPAEVRNVSTPRLCSRYDVSRAASPTRRPERGDERAVAGPRVEQRAQATVRRPLRPGSAGRHPRPVCRGGRPPVTRRRDPRRTASSHRPSGVGRAASSTPSGSWAGPQSCWSAGSRVRLIELMQ